MAEPFSLGGRLSGRAGRDTQRHGVEVRRRPLAQCGGGGAAGRSALQVLRSRRSGGQAGWISVVDPAEHTSEEARTLLETAHAAARQRYQRHNPEVTTPASSAPAELGLTMDELREVARYVIESAAHVQDVFQRAHPEDPRVSGVIDAARV